MARTHDDLRREVEQALRDPMDGRKRAGELFASFLRDSEVSLEDRQRAQVEIPPLIIKGPNADAFLDAIHIAANAGEWDQALDLLGRYNAFAGKNEADLILETRRIFEGVRGTPQFSQRFRPELLNLLEGLQSEPATKLRGEIGAWLPTPEGSSAQPQGAPHVENQPGVGGAEPQGGSGAPSSSPGDGDAGAEAFEQGRRAMELGEYGQAISYFEQVPGNHRLKPRADTLREDALNKALPPEVKIIIARLAVGARRPASFPPLASVDPMFARNGLADVNKIIDLTKQGPGLAFLDPQWLTIQEILETQVVVWDIYEKARGSYDAGEFQDALHKLNVILATPGGINPGFLRADSLQQAATAALAAVTRAQGVLAYPARTDGAALQEAWIALDPLPAAVKNNAVVSPLLLRLTERAEAIARRAVEEAKLRREMAQNQPRLSVRVPELARAEALLEEAEQFDWTNASALLPVERSVLDLELGRLRPLRDDYSRLGSPSVGATTAEAEIGQWASLVERLQSEIPGCLEIGELRMRGIKACRDHQEFALRSLSRSSVAEAQRWAELVKGFAPAGDESVKELQQAVRWAKWRLLAQTAVNWVGRPLAVILAVAMVWSVVSLLWPGVPPTVETWAWEVLATFGVDPPWTEVPDAPYLPGCSYASGHNICDDGPRTFETDWKEAAAIIGQPLTERTSRGGFEIQVFENLVLQFDPGLIGKDNRWAVQAQSIGRELVSLPGASGARHRLRESPPCAAGDILDQQTGFCVPQAFQNFFGSVRVDRLQYIGFPITRAYREGSLLVQWYEKARLELDTAAPDPQVRVGKAGLEYLCAVSLMRQKPPTGCPR